MKYDRDPRFEGYYFEGSFVLRIDEAESSKLAFSMLLALTPKHPLYSSPQSNDQHCYRNGTLFFEGISAVKWEQRKLNPIRDPDGTIDYGNLDVFELENGGRYCLEGEWGRVIVQAENAEVELQ